jgi:serine/threonine protein kinase
MALSEQRWKRVSESPYPWEREALEYIRTNLNDQPPNFGWCNFTFIDELSTVGLNEVDCLVVTARGIFLIEIKSFPGKLEGDRGTWTVTSPEGRVKNYDNPLILANLKAKKLKALLMRQPEFHKQSFGSLYIEPLIFLSNPNLTVALAPTEQTGLCWRSQNEKGNEDKPGSIIAAIKYRRGAGLKEDSEVRINEPLSIRIARAMDSAGIRSSERLRHIADYKMEDLLGEGPQSTWQDWSAKHVSLKNDYRRVRIYPKSTTDADAARTRSIAEREYQILRSLRHPGILEAQTFHDHDLGPAILFSREPDELRLDFYLDLYKDKLTLDVRLDLIRQLAEAVRYAHSRRVVHRALSPQSVLVTKPTSSKPVLKIFNWQASRDLETNTSQRAPSVTVQFSDYLDNASYVYLAPETFTDLRNRSESSDIFSLGAIAFHILTGRPPAPNFHELQRLLMEHQCLPLPAVLDAPSKQLDRLVRDATCPDMAFRTDTVTNFLDDLEEVEDQLTSPNTVENPLAATKDQLLTANIKVEKRLGTGGTAAVFLVQSENRTCVLKLALKPEYNERIRSEFEILQSLRDDKIVAPIGSSAFEIKGLAAFLMERAGEQTLASWLHENGRPSVEILQRFGEDLLDILEVLERNGIPHRDIKPENIGIVTFGRDKNLHLKLFDFSLSRHRFDDVYAGTTDYRDPFLVTRKLWDPAADRYSAAVLLYELASGTFPRFGDGRTAAHLSTEEAKLEPNLIDPPIREGLAAFFTRAFRRQTKERFDNALDMAVAWHNTFSQARATDSRPPDLLEMNRAIEGVTLESSIAELSLGARAENILDRESIFTVRALLETPATRIRTLRGVGAKTRNELIDALRKLRTRFPESTIPATKSKSKTLASELAVEQAKDRESIDDILVELLPKPTTKNQIEVSVIHQLLGLTPNASAWPSQSEIAHTIDRPRQQVGQSVSKFRDRWRESTPSLTRIRNLIAQTLAESDGYLELSELATAIVATRGSLSEEPIRSRRATALIRAAVEAERSLTPDKQRYSDNRLQSGILFTALPEGKPGWTLDNALAALSWAEQLAAAAAKLADTDPLPSPGRVLDTLHAIPTPADVVIPADSRLLRLAASLSGTALSPRLELYPVNMSAATALRLSAAALATVGDEVLSPEDVRKRVADRYPAAEAIPESLPELDNLLKETGLDLTRDPKANTYRSSQSTAATTTLYKASPRYSDTSELSADQQQARNEAEKINAILAASVKERSFLVLGAASRFMLRAEDKLQKVFQPEIISLDEALLSAMRRYAQAKKVDWQRVLAADAEPENSPDRSRLASIVSAVIPDMESELRNRAHPVLLTCPGLLARYNQLGMIERLRDNPGSNTRWLLVASSAQERKPMIDAKTVPVFSSAQWQALTPSWIESASNA